MAASGTVTLEIALLAKPMVVVYQLSRISYAVAKRVIKVPSISLVNLVAGRKVVPELIQNDARAEKMAVETAKLLQESVERKRMVQDLQEVSQLLGEKGASARTAEIALEMMR
jgi:lipid-A-disaccharide synthase